MGRASKVQGLLPPCERIRQENRQTQEREEDCCLSDPMTCSCGSANTTKNSGRTEYMEVGLLTAYAKILASFSEGAKIIRNTSAKFLGRALGEALLRSLLYITLVRLFEQGLFCVLFLLLNLWKFFYTKNIIGFINKIINILYISDADVVKLKRAIEKPSVHQIVLRLFKGGTVVGGELGRVSTEVSLNST